MIESSNPAVDIDALQARIDAAANEKQTAWFGIKNEPTCRGVLDLMVPEMQLEHRLRMPEDEVFHVADLVVFHNAEFIRNAYRVILKRKPDSASMSHYLHHLSGGTLSKIDILGRLRYAPEGRQIGTRIRGLRKSFLLHTLFHIPVAGKLMKFAVALVSLTRLQEKTRRFESTVFYEIEGIKRHYNRLAMNYNRLLSSGLIGTATTVSGGKPPVVPQGNGAAKRDAEPPAGNHVAPVPDGAGSFGGNQPPASADVFNAEWYVAFEAHFRGDEQAIRDRQRCYLPMISEAVAASGCGDLLDLGCGRGEWLELVGQQRITARGVDMNAPMVAECRAKGLEAVVGDLFDTLAGLENGSLAALTAFQVIEHLTPAQVMTLLQEAFRVLRAGGVAIFETPNPCNLEVGAANFYADPTHRQPIFPPTARFMALSVGFPEARLFYPPAPWPDKPYPDLAPDHPLAECINPLANLANTHFAASPDYALIAKR